ncbi:MAG: hypothetical protein AAFS10_14205, partial [Myxococcota bacterium]
EDLVYARIHFKDVTQGSETLGVHYHYEIIAGLGGMGFVSKAITKKIKQQFSADFFKAWHTHNAIEVGVFENFLPGLWAQRDDLSSMRYAKSMNPDLPSPATQTGYSKELFEQRLAGYAEADNAFEYLQPTDPTFLV